MQEVSNRRRPEERRGSQRGFSLVEVIMALAIFLVAALAAYAVYYMGTRSFKKAENATDLQQNTRAGFDRMVRELRLAGFNHNADGAPARPDEQIEGAWDTAVALRGDFDAEDPARRNTPEASLAGTFNIVTTGNDEIVLYALGKPTLPNSTAISFRADVVEAVRDGDEETLGVPGPVLVQNDPPYTLYRITPRNVSAMTGFDGTFDGLAEYDYQPVAENIRSLTFRYFDFSGNLVNPNTPADASDDIGGADAGRNARARIARVEVNLEGMTPDPDPAWVDPGDSNPATQRFRKLNLTASVTPRNLGRKGIQDLDVVPPTTPTGLSACRGHCKGTLLTWSPNPPSQLVTTYRVAYGTSASNLNSTQSTSNTWLHIDGLAETGTYFFAVAAADGAGNSSPYSTPVNITNVNNTKPGVVPGFAVAASTADPGILVNWTSLANNDGTVTGASGPGGCDFAKPVNRDLGGYALFRQAGTSDPSTSLGNAYVGPSTLNRNAVQHLDTKVVACRDYTYDIRALDACGIPGDDQPSTLTTSYSTAVQPAKPRNVNASIAGSSKNAVVWDAVSADVNGKAISVAGYKIYFAEGYPGNPPTNDDAYSLAGASTTNSFLHDYPSTGGPAPGNVFFYRVSAVDDCPNESALSDPAGASCAFDGQVIISPTEGKTVYGIVPITVSSNGSDTYTTGAVQVRDSRGNVVFAPATSTSYPFTWSWDTRSLLPDSYTITGAIINAAGCTKMASVTVNTVTTPSCCLSQTGQSLGSDSRANSNVVVRLIANLCENDLTASSIRVTWTFADTRAKLDDIRWNNASIISGQNYTSPFTGSINVSIPSAYNGGGEQVITFDFDRTLVTGDRMTFELTYSGAVVGTQTCTFSAVVN